MKYLLVFITLLIIGCGNSDTQNTSNDTRSLEPPKAVSESSDIPTPPTPPNLDE
jgi:hypothetical protein